MALCLCCVIALASFFLASTTFILTSKIYIAQCLFNPRHDAFFAEDLEQVVDAGAGSFAGRGQPAGMHQHAGFHAQRLGGFLERAF
jgi:hypothetical protein